MIDRAKVKMAVEALGDIDINSLNKCTVAGWRYTGGSDKIFFNSKFVCTGNEFQYERNKRRHDECEDNKLGHYVSGSDNYGYFVLDNNLNSVIELSIEGETVTFRLDECLEGSEFTKLEAVQMLQELIHKIEHHS